MRFIGRRRFAKLALAATATLFSLILVEFSLRVFDWPREDPVWTTCHETAFKFAPNLKYRHMSPEFEVAFQTNSLGLRDDEVGPKHGYRILLLGDSYTCGYGVEREELFADLLQRRLDVEVVNAGVGGFEIVHQLQFFRAQGRQLQPDLVVYALYLNNDLTGNGDWESSGDGGLRRRDGKPALETHGTAKLACLAKSFVPARRVVHALRRRYGNLPAALPGERYLGLCADPRGAAAESDYATSLELLRQLRDEVRAAGAELLVVSFPLRAVVEEDCPEHYRPPGSADSVCYDLLRPVSDFAEMLESAGIDHVALTDWLRASRKRLGVPLYFPNDGHLNPTGHRCLAEGLVGRLPVAHYRMASRSCQSGK